MIYRPTNSYEIWYLLLLFVAAQHNDVVGIISWILVILDTFLANEAQLLRCAIYLFHSFSECNWFQSLNQFHIGIILPQQWIHKMLTLSIFLTLLKVVFGSVLSKLNSGIILYIASTVLRTQCKVKPTLKVENTDIIKIQ